VSGGVPSAFRGRKATSFVGMHDDQVVKVAASALHMAQLLPAGSSTRAARRHTSSRNTPPARPVRGSPDSVRLPASTRDRKWFRGWAQ
jgi:hypothetical protein